MSRRSPSPRRYRDGDEDRDRERDRGRDDDRGYGRGRERSRSQSPRGEGGNEEVRNPGNNLYVSGLSSRTTERDLEDHFNREGKVTECRLVYDPRTKESRGFAFVTMDTVEGADRCIKYLDRSVLQGRVITVALAKRKRPRTPTPGKFLGVRPLRETAPMPPRDPYADRRGGYGDPYGMPPPRRSPDYAPYRRDRSPDYGPYRGGGGGGGGGYYR